MSNKPTVFNYRDYERSQEEIRRLRDLLAKSWINRGISVPDILEQVKSDMCDNYCKWPALLVDEPEDMLLDICDGCPLERL